MHDKTDQENKLRLLDLLVIGLSIYVLIALLVDTIFSLPPEISRILNLVDNAICIFFLLDFCIRFYHAESKWKFMKWGWIDIVSSVPNIAVLRAGRTLRLIRLLRILRAFRSTKNLVHHVFKSRAQGAFTTVIFVAIILMIFSSVSILQLETDPRSNIKTAEDAIWWSYVTITTVGYGDRYPVTTAGRIIGAILMTGGVGLFGTFTAYVSSWFLGGKLDNKEEPEPLNNNGAKERSRQDA